MTRRHLAVWWLALLAAAPFGSRAVEIQPRIGIAEIYTSNVDLQPDGEEQDDWVTSFTPGITLGFKGTAISLDLDYTLEALYYLNDSDRNEVYNQLAATTLVNVVGENLQLRGDAAIDQVNVQPSKPVTTTNINVTGNRADSFSWDVGPVWSQPVFGHSELEGELLVGRVDYGNIKADEDVADETVNIQDVDTLDGSVSLHSADDLTTPLSYELAYDYEKLEYQESGDAEQQSAYLLLGYRVATELRVFALGGMDSDFEDLNDSSLNQGRWEVGFNTSSATNVFEAAVGHRYFGTTWRVNWLQDRDDATYSLSYNETPTTTDLTEVREIPVYPPPVNPPPVPPNSDIGQPGSPNRYLEKRADAAARWELHRSALLIDAFWERQDDQISVDPLVADPTDIQDERSYGAGIDFSWFLGARSEAGVRLDWVSREYIDGTEPDSPSGEDELNAITLWFERELGPRTRLGIAGGYDSRDVSEGDENDYDEYWARIGIVRTFGDSTGGIDRRESMFPLR